MWKIYYSGQATFMAVVLLFCLHLFCLNYFELHIVCIPAWTRVEWCKIRRLMGKPRRCSSAFFSEERAELLRKRAKIRLLQQRKQNEVMNFKDLPDLIPLQVFFVFLWLYFKNHNPFQNDLLKSEVLKKFKCVFFEKKFEPLFLTFSSLSELE